MRLPGKILILNINYFFSKTLKTINGPKFGNLFILKLPKFGGNPVKTDAFVRFLRAL